MTAFWDLRRDGQVWALRPANWPGENVDLGAAPAHTAPIPLDDRRAAVKWAYLTVPEGDQIIYKWDPQHPDTDDHGQPIWKFWVVMEVRYAGPGDLWKNRGGALPGLLDPELALRNGIWHLSPGSSKGGSYCLLTAVIDAGSTTEALKKATLILRSLDGHFDADKAIVRIAPYEDAMRAYNPEHPDGPQVSPGDYSFVEEDWVDDWTPR